MKRLVYKLKKDRTLLTEEFYSLLAGYDEETLSCINREAREERLARRIAEDLSPEWAAEADRGNLSAEAVRSLAGMPKERQAEMHAAMEPWRRTKRELSDYVRSEGKA